MHVEPSLGLDLEESRGGGQLTAGCLNQLIMEYCTPAEVNSQESYPSAQWKPTVDYSAPRSESPGQQVREDGAPVEVTAADGFPSCPSKPLAENEDAASSVMPRKQDMRGDHVTYSGLHIYSSEDSDDDICAWRLKKTRSILEELFSEDSNELLDSASDSGKEFPSNSRNESDESSSDGSGSCRSSSGAPGPGAERTGGRHRSEDTVSVNTSQRKRNGKRLYNKKHYCLFCFKPFSKMARHLEDVHSKEQEVAMACSFPKGSKPRRIRLDELRHRGNYTHNIAVLSSGKGDLIPYKRPRGAVKPSDFMHCAHCQGLFTKKVLWRHMKVCKLRPKEHVPKPGKNRALSLCTATLPVPPNVSPALWATLSVMVPDEITDAVKNDGCVVQLGEYWMSKSGESAGSRGFVRQKLRELGKLLTSGRKVTSLRKLEDFIDPYNCMQAVEAVRHACEYDAETNSYRIPSLAKKLAVCLAQLSRLVRTKVVTPSDGRLAQRLRDFQKIHEERWNDLLCATVARNDEGAKWRTPTLLDFTEDVQKLHAFLDKTQDERMAQLSAEPSTKFWSELAKVSLTQVILFNRSREAEVSGMYLTTFLSRDSADPPTDIDWALTEVEKQLCRHFYKIVIRRVGARPVPVLLTLRMLRALQLLAERRETCGVLKDNAYVFARPSATTHYRGSDCVRSAAAACGAKDPYALTCGKLRKRIATLSTVLNLGDPETNQLANFLGHELIVHEEYYPLAERTLQLAKVYKVLTAIEQGRMMEFLGKNFSDISIPPNEEVELNNDKGKCREGSSVRGTFTTSHLVKKTKKKRKTWSVDEVQAVERHMKDFITSCRVPGKSACERCVTAEPLVLKNRDWQSVKFYVYNRIMAQKREANQKVRGAFE
ncbi:uncharacterized protein LOC113578850 isoform X2 [Electrophorus electricus]|uniref:uncharacterized protein LOC113578850 isoform X2 n=1 Tax=Electrophorus electricus TaxID=8005 RepID=UPI0015CFB034|nr:uncharacterized protein LOC113578850 isoform X2 [Electrophorus electricus]